MNIHNFTKTYKSKLIELIKNIDIDVIEAIIQSIELTVVNKSRIYIFGNGGSSATTSHMVNDLLDVLRR